MKRPAAVPHLQRVGPRQGLVHIRLGQPHRLRQLVPGPERRNRRRQAAPRAVTVARVHTGGPQHLHPAVTAQQVHGLRARQVPALEQHMRHPQPMQGRQTGMHRRQIGRSVDAQQQPGLAQVRRQQRHLRQQPRPDQRHIILIHQPPVRAGDHHRIEDHERRTRLRQPLGNHPGNAGIGHHADLHRRHRHVLEDRIQLRAHQRRIHRRHLPHRLRVLGDHRRDDGHPVGSQRTEHLQVRLDAGTTRRVGAGNRQQVGNRRSPKGGAASRHAGLIRGAGRGADHEDGHGQKRMTPQ